MIALILSAACSQFSGIEGLDYPDRITRWQAIAVRARSDPAFQAQLRAIATKRIKATDYERFIAAANLAGFGAPTRCGERATPGDTLERYLISFHGTYKTAKAQLACEPFLKTLTITIKGDPERSLQDTLWEILQEYYLDFRTERDGTFMIIRPVI
jgi:hypothetical protein